MTNGDTNESNNESNNNNNNKNKDSYRGFPVAVAVKTKHSLRRWAYWTVQFANNTWLKLGNIIGIRR